MALSGEESEDRRWLSVEKSRRAGAGFELDRIEEMNLSNGGMSRGEREGEFFCSL